LRLLEEELAERQVGVRDERRLRRLLDQLEVNLASILQVATLLVLVREVVQHLVELRVVRVVVLHHRVVDDRFFASGLHDLLRLNGVGLELADTAGVLLGRVLRLNVGGDLVALRRALELDVRFSQAPRELRPIRALLGGALVQALQALDFGDEQRAGASLQTILAGVALGVLLELVRVDGLDVVLALLHLAGRRRALERDGSLLLGVELGGTTGASAEGGLRFFADALEAEVGDLRFRNRLGNTSGEPQTQRGHYRAKGIFLALDHNGHHLPQADSTT
jgi:hypothetical protein